MHELHMAIGVLDGFLKTEEHFEASKFTLKWAVRYLKDNGHAAGMTPIM